MPYKVISPIRTANGSTVRQIVIETPTKETEVKYRDSCVGNKVWQLRKREFMFHNMDFFQGCDYQSTTSISGTTSTEDSCSGIVLMREVRSNLNFTKWQCQKMAMHAMTRTPASGTTTWWKNITILSYSIIRAPHEEMGKNPRCGTWIRVCEAVKLCCRHNYHWHPYSYRDTWLLSEFWSQFEKVVFGVGQSNRSPFGRGNLVPCMTSSFLHGL